MDHYFSANLSGVGENFDIGNNGPFGSAGPELLVKAGVESRSRLLHLFHSDMRRVYAPETGKVPREICENFIPDWSIFSCVSDSLTFISAALFSFHFFLPFLTPMAARTVQRRAHPLSG